MLFGMRIVPANVSPSVPFADSHVLCALVQVYMALMNFVVFGILLPIALTTFVARMVGKLRSSGSPSPGQRKQSTRADAGSVLDVEWKSVDA
jgi:hypothetical protein